MLRRAWFLSLMILPLALSGPLACDGDSGGDGGESPWVPVEPKTEQRGRYTIVWLQGTPYEMGRQHGELLHDAIEEAMIFVANDPLLSMLPEMARGLGIVDLASANSYPEILEECQGLVDATADVGFNMEFCLLLNFGDVMMENVPLARVHGEPVGPGCTQVVARDGATADGGFYHARNLDWGSMDISVIHQHPVIFVRQPADLIPHVFVGFPLNLSPYTGMNAAGLSSCSNEIDPADGESDEVGRSHVQMQARLLASASTLAEARAFLEGEDHMSAELITVADGNTREAAVFEMTARHFHVRELSGDLIYAVNHFLSPEMAGFDLAQDLDDPDSSILREERLEQLCDPAHADSLVGALDLPGLVTMMRDRVNPRTGVEAPWDDENIDNDAGIATNGPMHLVLFDPVQRFFWVAAGQLPIPAQPYVGFSLDELLGKSSVGASPAQWD